MRIVLVFVPMLLASACSMQPASPTGVYRLSMEDKSMVLQVRTGGEYVLQIDGPGRNTDEIRGQWEEESDHPHLILHGIVWHGSEPEAGHGIWAATGKDHAEICLDGEAASCFVKDGGA